MTSRAKFRSSGESGSGPILAVAGLGGAGAAGAMRVPRGGRSERPIEQIPVAQPRRGGHGHRVAAPPAHHHLRQQRMDSARAGFDRPKGRERPPASSASSRKWRSTIRTSMTTRSCRTCSAHLVGHRAPWRGVAGASGFPWLHPPALRLCRATLRSDQDGHADDHCPGDVTPVEIAHPLLLQPKPGAAALAAARATEAQEATRKAAEARSAADGSAAGGHTGQGAGSRGGKPQAQGRGANWRRSRASWIPACRRKEKQQAEEAKAQAVAKVAELQLQRDAGSPRTCNCESMPPRPRVTQPPRRKRRGSWQPIRPASSSSEFAASFGADQPQEAAALRPSGVQARSR